MTTPDRAKLRALVVDDSPICRALLREILEHDGDIEVVAEAESGRTALAMIARYAPALMTLDLVMPGMDGLDTVAEVMARHPLPILVVTSLPASAHDDLAFRAVRRGALDLCAKPERGDAAAAHTLRAQVRTLARVPVVRHLLRAQPPVASAEVRAHRSFEASTRVPRVIGIGASAGGPAAIAEVLRRLPADFPDCVAIVQHLPPGFAPAFARYLAGETALAVHIVEERHALTPGTVLLAPDGRHLEATTDGELIARPGPPVDGHTPSVTLLLRSLARVCGSAAVGVVLTGIGDDGAQGLAEMRAAGALTIAQDEASSAVFGMPRAAVLAGGATEVLALDAIADALVSRRGARR